jgi:hypothetical protein
LKAYPSGSNTQQGVGGNGVEVCPQPGQGRGFDERGLGKINADTATNAHPPDTADDVDQFGAGVIVKRPPDFNPDDVSGDIKVNECV